MLGLFILTGLVLLIFNVPGVGRTAVAMAAGQDSVLALGTALVSPDGYVLPFEVASVLMLAALVGAVYVATAR